MKMRELKRACYELELELGLDIEVESEYVAAAEAVVTAESQGKIPCSCCNELLDDAEQLHWHQMNRHSMAELSVALLTLRGLDLPALNNHLEDKEILEESSGLNRLLLDTVEERLRDSDGESTITVDSEARMATLNDMSPLQLSVSSPYTLHGLTPSALSKADGLNGPSHYEWTSIYSSAVNLQSSDDSYEYNSLMMESLLPCSKSEMNVPGLWTDVNGNDMTSNLNRTTNSDGRNGIMLLKHLMANETPSRDSVNRPCPAMVRGKMTYRDIKSEQKFRNDEFCVKSEYHSAPKTSTHLTNGIGSNPSRNKELARNIWGDDSRKPSCLYKRLSSVRKAKRHVKFQEVATCQRDPKTLERGAHSNDLLGVGRPTCGASPYKSAHGREVSSNKYGRIFCETCGRGYLKKSHLERHLRVHTGVRPYPCTVCDKRFAVRSILNQHLRVHTGERPYSCSICFQRFPQKSGLMTHMMLHTGKPFKCEFCVKSFVSNHKLMIHKRSHNHIVESPCAEGPYHCENCNMRFFTGGALSEHRKTHSDEAKILETAASSQSLAHSFTVSRGSRCTSGKSIPPNALKLDDDVTITEEDAVAAVAVVGKTHRSDESDYTDNFICKEEMPDDEPSDYGYRNESDSFSFGFFSTESGFAERVSPSYSFQGNPQVVKSEV